MGFFDWVGDVDGWMMMGRDGCAVDDGCFVGRL